MTALLPQWSGRRPVIRSNGTAVTNSAGAFHVQPDTFPSCDIDMGNGLCLASGNTNFNTNHRELRYDTRFETTVRPSVERLNLYLTGHHELGNGIEAFGEVGYYHADSKAVQPPVVNLNSLWIPASNYWNPFGPVTTSYGTIFSSSFTSASLRPMKRLMEKIVLRGLVIAWRRAT